MHERYGMTEQAFLEHGEKVYNECQIINEPFRHVIVVALTHLDYDATLYFNGKRFGITYDNMVSLSEAARRSAGYTVTLPLTNLDITLISMAGSPYGARDADSFIQFMNTLSHEIQHALIKVFARQGMDIYNEQEPHAYATGNVTRQVFEILAKQGHVFFMGMPVAYYRPVMGLGLVPPDMLNTLTKLTAASALMDRSIADTNGIVYWGNNNAWFSTTYFTEV